MGGSRPDHRQVAPSPGLRPSLLDGRREGAGSGRESSAAGLPRPAPGEGCAGRRVAKELGATGSTPSVVVARWPGSPGAGMLPGLPTKRSLSTASWSKGVAHTGCVSPPAATRSSPNFLLINLCPWSPLMFPKRTQRPSPAGCLSLPSRPVSRAAAGWRNPLRTAGRVDSRLGAPGQVGWAELWGRGGRQGQGDAHQRGPQDVFLSFQGGKSALRAARHTPGMAVGLWPQGWAQEPTATEV